MPKNKAIPALRMSAVAAAAQKRLESKTLRLQAIEEAVMCDIAQCQNSDKSALPNNELLEELLVRTVHGQSLLEISQLSHFPSYWSLARWVKPFPGESEAWLTHFNDFRGAYKSAQQLAVEKAVGEILAISDEAVDRDSALSAEVRIKVRQWMAERLLPSAYAPTQGRYVEEDKVEDFAMKMAQALQHIAENRKALQSAGPRHTQAEASNLVDTGEHEVIDVPPASQGN